MNNAYEHEREEWRDAARFNTGTCPPGQHRMTADGRGGGICACGFTVDREEL